MHRLRSLVLLALLVATGCTAVRVPGQSTKRDDVPTTLYVHASKALPDGIADRIEQMDGVRWARRSTSALVNLVNINGPKPLLVRASSSVLPFSLGAAEPLPDDADAVSAQLRDNKAVISTASAALYAVAPGNTFTVGLGARRATFTVGAVLDERRTTGVEALVPLWAARRLGVRDTKQVVVGVTQTKTEEVGKAASALASPVPVRVGGADDVRTPYAGRLLSLAEIKQTFGAFTFVRKSGRWLEPDPSWVERNITTQHVPVLGSMKCHRLIFAPLIGAMREVEQAGLAPLITEQSHCYAPRVQFGDTANISRHTWGIAVDINPTTNGFGDAPTQDPRLVEIMRRWGFAWGGVWLTPDGMHFEYTG